MIFKGAMLSYATKSITVWDQFCGCVQKDATTPNIVAPTILGVVACVLAVVVQTDATTPNNGKDTTHKSL